MNSHFLVSYIMPTANRRTFVSIAIARFLSQSYEHKELVILDNGSDSIEDLVPVDSRIRYYRETNLRKIGSVRNRACELSRGDFIAHWDDDDWYPSDRLERQIQQLTANAAELCGTSRLYFIDEQRACAWEYAESGSRPWIAGSSLVYRKTLWQSQPFPEVPVGEDTLFVARLPRKIVHDMADPTLCVATVHRGNTSPKHPGGTRWRSVPFEHIRNLMTDLPNPISMPNVRHIDDKRTGVQSDNSITSRICVGVYSRSEGARLDATLRSLQTHNEPAFKVILLGDGPDNVTRNSIMQWYHTEQIISDQPIGPAACFNRLLAREADIFVFLEGGAIVGPGWLPALLAALNSDPRHGIAGPTTNSAWSVQGALRDRGATDRNVDALARSAVREYGSSVRSLVPLYCLGDFCIAIRREVVDAIGGADEAYGLGPCWEMDFAVRAARAGWLPVWAQGAYVFRYPFSQQRQREEPALLEANRKIYQDKFCGALIGGLRTDYSSHCRGDACKHFAPSSQIPIHLPLGTTSTLRRIVTVRSVTDVPLVSCIMPTHGRSEWVKQSILYFERQDYPARELVIVDDGARSLQDTLPCDPRIRYIHSPRRLSVGAKRNLACQLARGSIIAHWDDDDWYAATRLTIQSLPIIAGDADVTALRGTVMVDLRDSQFWICSPALFGRMFAHAVHGGTLVYARQWIDKVTRFPDVSLAEDAAFLRTIVQRGARLLPLDSDGLYVYVRHGTNAWRFPCGTYLDPSGWKRVSMPKDFIADKAFYEALSHPIPVAV
jgi:glycosyltransferase involved in cell wall biosynthesis